MKAWAAPKSHSVQTRWETDPADHTRGGWGQAEIQELIPCTLPFTCNPAAVVGTSPTSPSLGASSMAGACCRAANDPGPSAIRTGEPVECTMLLFLLLFLDFPPVQPKGRVRGWSHYRSAHTQGPGRAPGIHSWGVAGESRLHISPSDRIVFPSMELVSQAGPCGTSRDYKALQILLQSASEKIFHIFPSPWSPSYTQTATQAS